MATNQIPGQLTVDDCIRIAATGADGRPPTTEEGKRVKPSQPPEVHLTGEKTIKDLTRLTDRVTALKRLQAIKDGDLVIPLRCGTCRHTLTGNARSLQCLACGRNTLLKDAKAERVREMKRTVFDGLQ